MSEHKALTGVVLAALRHLQADVGASKDLGHLSDIADPGLLSTERLDDLAERLNMGDLDFVSSACHDSEVYRCVAMSTAHLSDRDVGELLRRSASSWMIFAREPGFLVKLYDSESSSKPNTSESYRVAPQCSAYSRAAA